MTQVINCLTGAPGQTGSVRMLPAGRTSPGHPASCAYRKIHPGKGVERHGKCGSSDSLHGTEFERPQRPVNPPNRYPHPSAGPYPGRVVHRRVRRSERSAIFLVTIGLVIAVATGLAGAWSYALVAAWGGVSVTYLAWVWREIGHLGGRGTADHATADDPGHRAMEIMLVAAAVASLANVIYVLAASRNLTGAEATWHAVGALVSVVLSWAVIHTLFTLRYARLYHMRGRGIDFNSGNLPTYLDFAYVAFSVGMTYQVSDTAISVAPIRREVLRHALLSYLFGTVVLAAAVNLVAGLMT